MYRQIYNFIYTYRFLLNFYLLVDVPFVVCRKYTITYTAVCASR
jgi:hypothetical protein